MGTGRGRGKTKWRVGSCDGWRWMALDGAGGRCPGAGTGSAALTGPGSWGGARWAGWAAVRASVGCPSPSMGIGKFLGWDGRVCGELMGPAGPGALLLAGAALRYSASSALNSSSRPIILHRPGQACLGAGPAPVRIVGARLCLERGPCRRRWQRPGFVVGDSVCCQRRVGGTQGPKRQRARARRWLAVSVTWLCDCMTGQSIVGFDWSIAAGVVEMRWKN